VSRLTNAIQFTSYLR